MQATTPVHAFSSFHKMLRQSSAVLLLSILTWHCHAQSPQAEHVASPTVTEEATDTVEVAKHLELDVDASNEIHDAEQHNNDDAITPPNQDEITSSRLKSLAQLKSLQGVKTTALYQTPFVQELENTAHVRSLFVATQALPIVDIQLTFNAGSAQDEYIGKGLYGLSSLAARLMTEGTDQYSAAEVANRFESLGASFSVSSYRDMFVIRLRSLSDPQHLQPAIDLMLHILNHATFKRSDLSMMLSSSRVGQKQVQENPISLRSFQFYRSVYQEHPYAYPSAGTNLSLTKITREHLQQFRQQLLVKQNMSIALTGHLSTQQASDIANKISNSLATGQKAPSLAAANAPQHFNVQYIPASGQQAYVMMGHLAVDYADPDRVALEVANQILGGKGLNSILMRELRVKHGLTYGIYSQLSALQARGVFQISYSTALDDLIFSLTLSHRALIDFVEQPIDQTALDDVKAGMLRAFPMSFSSNERINAQIAAMAFYDLPNTYLKDYQQQLSSLTAKQIHQAVQRHLHPDQLTLVVVAESLDLAALQQSLEDNLATSRFALDSKDSKDSKD
ncbi:M16 family metallopeptidase [Acinetobacter larvae]|uniref:Peptidase M16 n=1 Tax=Acinetobacter larvae TaxID=1789224 RepID=A0A1B2M099_9GAMM|nr:pitrilysin family protein [Acinetobacter larvae]AOA58626.1 hypothetical protein BFG52_09865 [Acinetobacter larvae]